MVQYSIFLVVVVMKIYIKKVVPLIRGVFVVHMNKNGGNFKVNHSKSK